jgi:hypothetical protein
MAPNYWDYQTTSNTTTGTYYTPKIWQSSGTTSTTGGNWTNSPTTSTWGNTDRVYYYSVVRVEKCLVRPPEHWGEAEIAGFTRLINDETKTGWKIEMWINGDIKITDPTIQIRDMAGFLPLLKQYANRQDLATIDAFFAVVPIVAPEPVA